MGSEGSPGVQYTSPMVTLKGPIYVWPYNVIIRLDDRVPHHELGILRALSGVNRPGTRRSAGWIPKRLSEAYADIAIEYAKRL